MKKFLLILLLLIPVEIVAQSFPFRSVREGGVVPNARVFDLNSGKVVDVKSLMKKRIVVFLFWGADSKFKKEHSLRAIKGIVNFKNELPFDFYPINVQNDDPKVIKQVLSEAGYIGPVLVDKDKEVYKYFGIFVMPSLLIAREGRIFKGFGYTYNLPEITKLYIEVALGIKTEEEAKAELNPKQKELPENRKEALRFYRLGVTMLERGMPLRAIDAFKKAVGADGSFIKAYLGLAVAYLETGKSDELSKVIELLERKTSNDFRVLVLKARYLLTKGKLDEALKLANQLVFTRPESPDISVLLGDIYYAKGSWKKSSQFYRKALNRCYKLWEILER